MKGVAEGDTIGAGEPGYERSKIDIAKGEVFARREIIELIAEIAVPSVREHLDKDCHPRQCPRNPHSTFSRGFTVISLVVRLVHGLGGALSHETVRPKFGSAAL